MEQPTFIRDANGETYELKPVKVNRKALVDDVANAKKAADQVDKNVKHLEDEAAKLTEQLGAVNDRLGPLYDQQEAAQEELAFRTARLERFDQTPTAGEAPVDGAPGAAAEAVAGAGADEPAAASEELADSDEGDEPEDEEEELPPSEDLVVPVRRRAGV